METDVGQSLIGRHGDRRWPVPHRHGDRRQSLMVVMETDVGQSLIGRHGYRRWSVPHRSSWRQTLVSPS